MIPLDKVHAGFVYPRRIGRLAQRIAKLVPRDARILAVGCGDGRLALEVSKLRPDVELEGIDVLIRKETFVPVTKFDGKRIPYEDASFDVVMFVDVLDHTNDPHVLLKEAKRVARKAVL
ncbi:MAG: class I SAM-dependent methyltransferase [Terriglobales bacterium]